MILPYINLLIYAYNSDAPPNTHGLGHGRKIFSPANARWVYRGWCYWGSCA